MDTFGKLSFAKKKSLVYMRKRINERCQTDEIPKKLIHIDAARREREEKNSNSSHTKKASEIDVKYNYD